MGYPRVWQAHVTWKGTRSSKYTLAAFTCFWSWLSFPFIHRSICYAPQRNPNHNETITMPWNKLPWNTCLFLFVCLFCRDRVYIKEKWPVYIDNDKEAISGVCARLSPLPRGASSIITFPVASGMNSIRPLLTEYEYEPEPWEQLGAQRWRRHSSVLKEFVAGILVC